MYLPPFLRKILKKREMLSFYRQYITNGDLCFDVGANRGERTEVFLKLGARVVAFEPQSSCLLKLQEKFKDSAVILEKVALGAETRESSMHICAESDECSSFSEDFIRTYEKMSGFHWPQSERVMMRTLDEYIRTYGAARLCKIDVEGFESEVFRGMGKALPLIFFEFNRPLLHDSMKCLEIAASLGDYRCNFLAYEHMKLVLKEDMPLNEFRKNLYELIPEEMLSGEIMLKLS